MNRLRLVKWLLAVSITAFAIAAAYVSFAVMERQRALREVSRYNMVWAVSQALSEFHRFEHRVAAFGLGAVGKDEVMLRFDILYNRLNIFRGGEIKAFTEAQPAQRAVVEEFAALLSRIEPLLDRLDQPGTVERILGQLTPLESKLSRLAAAANEFGGDQVAADQRHLLDLHWAFSAIAGGLVFCGLAFIVLLYIQNRMLAKAHQSLRALTDDLRVAKNAAEAGSEAKSRFLATMSHELRTPLNAVIGFSEIINKQAFGQIGQPKYIDYAGDILKAGQHMLEIVGDVLTMARLDADRYEVNAEPVALESIAELTVGMFRGTEIGRQRQIRIQPGPDWACINADRQAVRQMLLNLLSNAAKFSEPDTAITISCALSPSGEVLLTVTDEGIGMTGEQVARVGQPFYQADDRLARRYEGSGLGLSIVSGLLKAHGGRLAIASRPGVGTRASLVFPGALVQALVQPSGQALGQAEELAETA